MENKITEDMILNVSAKAERLGTIARVAACAEFFPEKQEKIYTDVLLGIADLSEQLVSELDKMAATASGVRA